MSEWSKTPPTKPGYYWTRRGTIEAPLQLRNGQWWTFASYVRPDYYEFGRCILLHGDPDARIAELECAGKEMLEELHAAWAWKASLLKDVAQQAAALAEVRAALEHCAARCWCGAGDDAERSIHTPNCTVTIAGRALERLAGGA